MNKTSLITFPMEKNIDVLVQMLPQFHPQYLLSSSKKYEIQQSVEVQKSSLL